MKRVGDPFQIFGVKCTQTVATHLLSCEALTDDLSVLVDVKVLSVTSITVSHPSLLHCKYKHTSSENQESENTSKSLLTI